MRKIMLSTFAFASFMVLSAGAMRMSDYCNPTRSVAPNEAVQKSKVQLPNKKDLLLIYYGRLAELDSKKISIKDNQVEYVISCIEYLGGSVSGYEAFLKSSKQ